MTRLRARLAWARGRLTRLLGREPELDTGDPHALGRFGEELAARDLVGLGWRIRGRRVATRAGEVDLVAEEPGGRLVCVEVKTRRVPPLPRRAGAAPVEPAPRSPLGRRQLQRLRRAARELGATRVDLIEVRIVPGEPPDVRRRPLP